MALTPQQMLQGIEQSVKTIADTVERQIDKVLVERFQGGEVWIKHQHLSIPGKPVLRNKVLAEIRRRYEEAGWSVESHDDQREGASLKFTPARIWTEADH